MNDVRRAGARSEIPTTTMLIIAAGTAYCHPKSTCIESRNTMASETVWPPFSSSGTGLNSAATAATRTAHAPATVRALGGCATTEPQPRPPPGYEAAMITAAYRSSRGG